MTSPSRPAIAATLSGILVGAAIVATRSVIDQTTPIALAFLRYLIGFCCLLPPVLLSARARFVRRDLLPIGLLGITQFGVLVILLNASLEVIPSSRAALIFATMPLQTMLVGTVIRRQQSSPAQGLGVLLTIAGVGFALGQEAVQRGGVAGSWTGEIMALTSAASGAVCSVLYRPYLRRYPILPLSAFAMLTSVGFLGVLTGVEGSFTSLPAITARGWLAVAFIGASSGAGYYLWLWALSRATPTKVTVFLALGPITATVLGALFLSEAISIWALVGLTCVALGIWLAHREPR
jgi:drug/metabolite transporter (DMT)-like permease